MMAITLAALLLLGNFGDHVEMCRRIFVHTVFNALQNVAVDGLHEIDLLDKSERGRASGIMYGSKYLGGMAGSAGSAS